MIHKCAWCDVLLGEDNAEPRRAVSHGCCEPCLERLNRELDEHVAATMAAGPARAKQTESSGER